MLPSLCLNCIADIPCSDKGKYRPFMDGKRHTCSQHLDEKMKRERDKRAAEEWARKYQEQWDGYNNETEDGT